jgi:hypothetical protein
VDLAAGQEMQGIDFTLRVTRAVSVQGRVVNPPSSNVQVSVNAQQSGGGGGMGAAAGRDGVFVLRNLVPGSYTLNATAMVEQKQYTTEIPIQVGADGLEGIELTLVPPTDLKGVLRIEGGDPAGLNRVLVTFPGGGPAEVRGDGSFEPRALPARVYRPMVAAPGALFLKSMRCGTTDVTESGIDLTQGAPCDLTITMSANGGEINGQAQGEEGQPAQAVVTLVPAGTTRREDLFREVGTDASGQFKMNGIAPGKYHLFAWESVDTNAVRYDADFMKPYESKAAGVEISEGDKQTVTLKRIPAPAEQ